jgi:hypothetical protein
MTDLDPLASPPREGAELRGRTAREPARRAPVGMDGPTGHNIATESAGDPDRASVASGGEAGAGAGMMAGAVVAGPVGLAIGGAAGAAAGAAAEAADVDTSTNEPDDMSNPGSEGTVSADPAVDATGRERDPDHSERR